MRPAILDLDQHTHRKVTWRLLPFLFLCYILAYLDRVNVGFARLQMQADLGFSDTAYGIGAGIFFIGYFFFEVPSNLLMRRVGARLWIARIMVLWGLVSAALMFANSVTSFYVIRFLLGVAEAGFFLGIIWVLTQWYTRAHRAADHRAVHDRDRGVAGRWGPLSGWILEVMDGVSAGARVAVALPSRGPALGDRDRVAVPYLDDGPETAAWLTPDERALVRRRSPRMKNGSRRTVPPRTMLASLPLGSRLGMLAIYFGAVMGIYGVTFWLPQIISETISRDPLTIGPVSTIPGVSPR